MNLGACNCCEEPPCAEPVLEFVSVVGEVCGEINPEDGLTYSVIVETDIYGKTTTRSYTVDPETGECSHTTVCGGGYTETSYSKSVGCWQSFGDPIYQSTQEHNVIMTVTYPEDCEAPPEVVYSGSGSNDWICIENCEEARGAWGATYTYDPATGEPIESLYGDDPPFLYPPGGFGVCDPEVAYISTVTRVPEIAAEATTDYSILAEISYPEWPAWEGESEDPLLPGQGYLGTSELSATVRRKIKYRLRHLPSGTCYLKVWIRKTFTPAATVPPTDPLPAPTITESTYEWVGTGNPCLTVPTDAIDAESQKISGTPIEVPVPSGLGTTAVEILKYSCVSGYEPDISDPENPQPNGFPDPEWEAAPP
jgi:hypothetical protein